MSHYAPLAAIDMQHDCELSLQSLQNIIEVLPMRIFWKDKNLRYLGCNSLFARDAGGQTPADIIGKSDYDLAWHEQAALYRADDQQVMRESKVKLAYQEPQTTAKGEHIWLRTSKVPLTDDAGQVVGVLGMYDDITERMGSELEYRSILNTTQDGFVTTDLNGQFLDVNDTYCAMLGYQRHELLAMSVKDIDILEDEQAAKQHIQNVVQFGRDRFETKQRHKDGRALNVEVSVNFVDIAQGVLVAFVRDVSEKKHKEQQEIARRQILELMATGSGLKDVLDRIAKSIEQNNPHLSCVIFMLDALEQQLDISIVSAIPDACKHFFNVDKDLCTHCLCDHYPQEPKRETVVLDICPDQRISCSTELIVSANNKLLGKVALCHAPDYLLTKDDEGVIKQALYLSSVAIEQHLAKEAQEIAAMVYEHSSEAMLVTNAQGLIMAINPAFTTLTGYGLAEVKGKTPSVLSSGKQGDDFYGAMWDSINTSGEWQGEIWNRRKSGEIYPEWLTINTIVDDHGQPHRRVALFSDISKHKETEALIWKQAHFDSLTGLPNRQMFYDRLNQELKKSHHENLPMALLFLDLDRFKEVNDSLGHDAGDLLLIETTKRIQSCVREADTVSRLGGDEFTIILGELKDHYVVERIAKDILKKLVMPFELAGSLAYVSASIGITFYPNDGDVVETLIKNADQAMYAAKALGRNQLHYFTPQMQEAAQKRLTLINDLHIALDQQQFLLHYQPIIELKTGRIHKAEALVRWQHPVRGMVSPADFISIAEETDLIVRLGEWVFLEAVKQLSHWQQVCPLFQMSINTSPLQFQRQHALSRDWMQQLQAVNLSGSNLIVEITESLLMDVNDSIKQQLLDFSDNGIQVAMDDFGTGYSSLSYLKKFDIDYIKIDQSFVRNMAFDDNDLALCEAIVVMAHKLGIKVVAEGIETQAQRDLLLAMGCDYGQGYLFSRPVTAEQFSALLVAQQCVSS